MKPLMISAMILALLAVARPLLAREDPPLAALRELAVSYVQDLDQALIHGKDHPDTRVPGMAVYKTIPASTVQVRLIPTQDPVATYLGKVTYMEYEYVCVKGFAGLQDCALSGKTRMTEFFAYEWGGWTTPVQDE